MVMLLNTNLPADVCAIITMTRQPVSGVFIRFGSIRGAFYREQHIRIIRNKTGDKRVRGLKRILLAGSASLFVVNAGGLALADDAAAAETEVEGLTVTGMVVGEPIVTKSDVPLLETPQAISVITADTLREQGITRLADALRGVAGVTRSSTYGYFDSYQIRARARG